MIRVEQLATECGIPLGTAVAHAADDAESDVVGVVQRRRSLDTDGRDSSRPWAGDESFAVTPLGVAASWQPGHFLALALAHVADPNLVRQRIIMRGVRTAEAEGCVFFQDRAGRIEPRIVIGNSIALGVAGRPACRLVSRALRLAADGVGFRWIIVHVDPENAAEKPEVQLLSAAQRAIRASEAAAFIAITAVAAGDV